MSTNAYEIHQDAWADLLSAAHEATYQKYGLYTSRILAVKHPEVYLKGDNLFWQIAHSTRGFQTAYETSYVADWYMMELPDKIITGQNEGLPLSLRKINPKEYTILDHKSLYPDDYPFIPFLDQRMAPLAVSLKAVGKKISAIEAGEQAYFREKEGGKEGNDLYLMYCDDGGAYLCTGGILWSMRDGEKTDRPQGNPILIFNEEYVWYPLMGRDDTQRAKTLQELVDSYSTSTQVPSLTIWEKELLKKLQEASTLRNETQVTLASLVAARAGGFPDDSFTTTWNKILPEEEFDPWALSRKMGIVRECNRFANYLSPVAAYLASMIEEAKEMEIGIRSAGAEYLEYAGVVREDERGWKKPGRVEAWGHLWCCCLMEYTIDDSYHSRGGHCVSQSMNLSAVLDLAGVEHYVTHFNRGGFGSRDHHFVYSMEGDFVIDDGIVNYFARDHEKTGDWVCLLSFSKEGKWASTVAEDKIYGNLSPREMLEALQEIKGCVGDRFQIHFLKDDEVVPYDSFTRYLGSSETGWEPVELP